MTALQKQLKVLPPVQTPFLTINSTEKPFTLVLDLDETLIHYVDMGYDESFFLIRPYCIQFLTELSHYYEIVIFTAGV